MEQTVYADLYFLINFSMDFLCLFLSAKLLSAAFSFWRTLLAAALGGVWAVAVLFFTFSPLLGLLVDVAAGILLTAIAFCNRHTFRSLPVFVLVFVAVSIALGGSMTMLFHLWNRIPIPDTNGAQDGISVWLFAILAILGGLLTRLGSQFFARKSTQKYVCFTFWIDGVSVPVRALYDSGNLLRDPLSGKPCILIDASCLQKYFPRLYVLLSNPTPLSLQRLSPQDAKRFHLIPVHTATGDSLLVALRPDRILLGPPRRPRELDALLILSNGCVTADGADALIPSELL